MIRSGRRGLFYHYFLYTQMSLPNCMPYGPSYPKCSTYFACLKDPGTDVFSRALCAIYSLNALRALVP